MGVYRSSFRPKRMKLAAICVAYLTISGTNGQDARRRRNNRNNRNNRTLGKRDALAQYINKLQTEGDGRYDPLFAQVISVKAQAEGLPDHMYRRILNALSDNSNRQITNCDPSTSTCQTPISFSAVWGYGCWCNFGNELTTGSGKPVDDFDHVCKDLQMCLRCSKLDAKEAGDFCDPLTQQYSATYNFQQDDATMVADCTAQNPNSDCANQVCSCELKFISNYIDLQWSNSIYTANNKLENGFDQENTCPKVGTVGTSKSCCGSYPSRTPYGGRLECCQASGSIYNPLVSECCGVTGTAAIGAC